MSINYIFNPFNKNKKAVRNSVNTVRFTRALHSLIKRYSEPPKNDGVERDDTFRSVIFQEVPDMFNRGVYLKEAASDLHEWMLAISPSWEAVRNHGGVFVHGKMEDEGGLLEIMAVDAFKNALLNSAMPNGVSRMESAIHITMSPAPEEYRDKGVNIQPAQLKVMLGNITMTAMSPIPTSHEFLESITHHQATYMALFKSNEPMFDPWVMLGEMFDHDISTNGCKMVNGLRMKVGYIGSSVEGINNFLNTVPLLQGLTTAMRASLEVYGYTTDKEIGREMFYRINAMISNAFVAHLDKHGFEAMFEEIELTAVFKFGKIYEPEGLPVFEFSPVEKISEPTTTQEQ